MEKVDSPVNLKLLIGQLAIILLILGGLGFSYLNFPTNSYRYTIPILCWTAVVKEPASAIFSPSMPNTISFPKPLRLNIKKNETKDKKIMEA